MASAGFPLCLGIGLGRRPRDGHVGADPAAHGGAAAGQGRVGRIGRIHRRREDRRRAGRGRQGRRRSRAAGHGRGRSDAPEGRRIGTERERGHRDVSTVVTRAWQLQGSRARQRWRCVDVRDQRLVDAFPPFAMASTDPDRRPSSAAAAQVGKAIEDPLNSKTGDGWDWSVMKSAQAGTLVVVTRSLGEGEPTRARGVPGGNFSQPAQRSIRTCRATTPANR